MVKILKTITVFALTALLAAGLAACGTAASAEVSRDDAINEALMHVEGAGKDDVVSVEEDENEYDIEIYYDGVEYSFDISKKDGSVLNASTENDNKGQTGDDNLPSSDESTIGLAAAKNIALGEVSGAAEKNIVKAKEDYDDGRTVYEIEIVYKEYEYDFEIDGVSGDIIEKDIESVYD